MSQNKTPLDTKVGVSAAASTTTDCVLIRLHKQDGRDLVEWLEKEQAWHRKGSPGPIKIIDDMLQQLDSQLR